VPPIDETVLAALATHLQMPVDELARRREEDLGLLGLDSHGLMRVLLEIERVLGLSSSLELADAELATPASMVAGVRAQVDRA
jgi:acyl carrier protein